MTIQYYKQSSTRDEHTILLNENMIKQWKIPTGQTIHLQFGSIRTYVQIHATSKSKYLQMHPKLALKMNIKQRTKLFIRYEHETLMLGPLIGVIVSHISAGNIEQRFGSITKFCREFHFATQKYGGIAFFFSPRDVRMGHKTMAGWHYNNGWYKSHFPIPNVIYNRLSSHQAENKIRVQQFFNEVKSKHKTQIFNERFLNKAVVFQALQNEEAILHYLPETRTLSNLSTLTRMLDKYTTVFLKPVRGNLGKGIIKARKQIDGSVQCYYTFVNGVKLQQYSSVNRFYQSISTKIKAIKYQIQQGVHLLTIKNRPVDFRVMVQKDEAGKWTVTSIMARSAGTRQFVSNVARGGAMHSAEKALAASRMGVTRRNEAITNLKHAAINIATAFDKQIHMNFGELGIDLGIEQNGKVWLIEINSKPSKKEDSRPESNAIRTSTLTLVKYARHLSGFGK